MVGSLAEESVKARRKLGCGKKWSSVKLLSNPVLKLSDNSFWGRVEDYFSELLCDFISSQRDTEANCLELHSWAFRPIWEEIKSQKRIIKETKIRTKLSKLENPPLGIIAHHNEIVVGRWHRCQRLKLRAWKEAPRILTTIFCGK